MRTFINSEGIEIFKLDNNGNLWLAGNLNLKPESTITAGNIRALVNSDVAVVRDVVDMQTPYLGDAGVVYYLGETTDTYTHGTWWEKYTIGYTCDIDTSINKDSQFIIYEPSFTVYDDDTYSHNKQMLDQFPTTTKIVLGIVSDDEGTHWEIMYYAERENSEGVLESELLYTDVLESNLLYFTGYNFPFSPLNSDDYDEGYTTIVININPIYALKEIQPIDWSLYMPIAGGTFEGIINTQNLAPVEKDKYIIGTEEGRYKAGYFKELYSELLKVKNIEIEELNLEQFSITKEKTNLHTGDGLLITDSEEDNNVKISSTIKFDTTDTKQFLRHDGTFATPNPYIPRIEQLDNVEKLSGAMFFYEGTEYPSLVTDTAYIGVKSKYNYQLRFKGVTFDLNNNACIVDKNLINQDSLLLQELNNLGFGNIIEDFVENKGEVTLLYNSSTDGWKVKGFETKGTVSSKVALQDTPNEILLNGLIYPNTIYNIDSASKNIELTISKFIWEPLSSVVFDGRTTNKFLSQAGTWEYVSTSNSEEGTSLAGLKTVYGTITKDTQTGAIYVNGLNNVLASGMYEIRNYDDNTPIATLLVATVGTSVTQSIYGILQSETFYRTLKTAIPEKLYRKGIIGTGNVTTWENWVCEFNPYQSKISLEAPGTWRTMTYSEWDYLINTRPNAETLKGNATIGDTKGLVIIKDTGLPEYSNYTAHFTPTFEDYSTNTYTPEEWDKYYSSVATFLPITGQRLVSTVTNTSSQELPTGVYWAATRDVVDTLNPYAFVFNDSLLTITNIYGPQTGFAVRLAKDSIDGGFSVGENKKVIIAQGNLQYNPNAQAFRFAKHSYDVIGEHNANINTLYKGWLDLFGYGTALNPINNSENAEDYSDSSIELDPTLDWGVSNAIYKIEYTSIASCLEDDY